MWIEDGQNHDLYWIWWSLEIQEWDMAADPETASARRYGGYKDILIFRCSIFLRFKCLSCSYRGCGAVITNSWVSGGSDVPLESSIGLRRAEQRGCNLDKWSWLVFSNLDIGTRIVICSGKVPTSASHLKSGIISVEVDIQCDESNNIRCVTSPQCTCSESL